MTAVFSVTFTSATATLSIGGAPTKYRMVGTGPEPTLDGADLSVGGTVKLTAIDINTPLLALNNGTGIRNIPLSTDLAFTTQDGAGPFPVDLSRQLSGLTPIGDLITPGVGSGITAAGTADIQLDLDSGATLGVDLAGLTTLGAILGAFSAQTGGAVTAAVAPNGISVVFTDTTGTGSNLFTMSQINGSTVLQDLLGFAGGFPASPILDTGGRDQDSVLGTITSTTLFIELATVAELLATIPPQTSTSVTGSVKASGLGFEFTDSTAGGTTFSIAILNASLAMADLGFTTFPQPDDATGTDLVNGDAIIQAGDILTSLGTAILLTDMDAIITGTHLQRVREVELCFYVEQENLTTGAFTRVIPETSVLCLQNSPGWTGPTGSTRSNTYAMRRRAAVDLSRVGPAITEQGRYRTSVYVRVLWNDGEMAITFVNDNTGDLYRFTFLV